MDPRVLDRLRQERNETLRMLAGGGYMTDLTLQAMAKLAAARLQHLTEPNEGIAVRTMRRAQSAFEAAPSTVVDAGHAVAEYLTNSNETN